METIPKPSAVYDRTPGNLGVRVALGDDWRCQAKFVRRNPETNESTPLDMSGWSFEAFVQDSAGIDIITLGVDTTDAGTGLLTVSATDAELSALVPGTYRWFLRSRDTVDVDMKLLAGSFEVSR